MNPQRTTPPARPLPKKRDYASRKDGVILKLMELMGSKRGYIGLPPDQVEWQAVAGEPPLYRLWSCMVQHTAGWPHNTPYATLEGGAQAHLKDLADLLHLDLGHVSNLWKLGEQKGLWHRGKHGELYLNGRVKASEVLQANKRRTDSVHSSWTPAEMLIAKGWPAEQRNRFEDYGRLLRSYHAAELAAAVADKRQKQYAEEDSIRALFPLPPKTRIPKEKSQVVEPPPLIAQLLTSVHSTPVQATPVVCTDGEERGENATVQNGASLLPVNKKLEECSSAVGDLLEVEADYLVGALQIDADAAVTLLNECRKVTPETTWREVLELCRFKLRETSNPKNRTGLLLRTIPAMAKGTMLDLARKWALSNMVAITAKKDHGGVPLSPAELRQVEQYLGLVSD